MAHDLDDIFDGETKLPSEEVILAGHYRIVRELGRGAQGSVYLGEDLNFGKRRVAVKMPPAVLAGNKKAVATLRAEAEMAMRLSHPHIVTLRTFESTGEGVFLVMDYVEGRTLEDILADENELPADRVFELFSPLAAALDYAHGEKVIHRDIKPSNILVRESDGRPLLTDFGIARELKDTMTRVTGKGTSGTLPYMSPEQVRGDAPAPGQDVYGLAATMYECLSGNPPFFRGEIADQIKTKEPEPLSPASPFTDRIMRGLAKDPADRSATCRDLVEGASEAAPASSRSALSWILAAAAVLALAVVLAVVFATGSADPPTDRSPGSAKAPDDAPEERPPTRVAPPEVLRPAIALAEPAETTVWTRDPSCAVKGRLENAPGGHVRMGNMDVRPDPDGSFETRLGLVVGENPIVLTPVDREGVEGDAVRRTVMLDTVSPEVAIELPRDGAVVGTATVDVSGVVTDDAPDHAVIGGARRPVDASGRFTGSAALSEEGENTIRVEGVDRAGNRVVVTVRVTRDTTGPRIRVDEPADGALVREAMVTVRGRLEDAHPAGRVTIDGAVRSVDPGGSFTGTVRLREGRQPIRVGGADALGNEATSVVIRVTLDSNAPEITLEAVASPTASEQVTIAGRVSEDGCRVTVKGAAVTVTGRTFRQVVSLSEGANPIEVVAWDQVGNRAHETVIVARRRAATAAPAGKPRNAREYSARTSKAFAALDARVWNTTGKRWNPQGSLEVDHRATGLTFVLIPAGSFWMGSPTSETDRDDDEKRHRVTVGAFLLCKTECTQRAWVRCGGTNRSNWKGDDLPVENASWDDADAWFEGLDRTLRFPTEAEWEYACRAGTEAPFSTGATLTTDQANYDGNHPYGGGRKGVYRRRTVEAGSLPPNPWGLHEMHGNVWEWCSDAYGSGYRVLRGGSWSHIGSQLPVRVSRQARPWLAVQRPGLPPRREGWAIEYLGPWATGKGHGPRIPAKQASAAGRNPSRVKFRGRARNRNPPFIGGGRAAARAAARKTPPRARAGKRSGPPGSAPPEIRINMI